MKIKALFLISILFITSCASNSNISSDENTNIEIISEIKSEVENESYSESDENKSIQTETTEETSYDLEAFFDTANLPAESTKFSEYLALKCLHFSGYANNRNTSIFKQNGYEVSTYNLNKTYYNVENTTSFLTAHKKIDFYGKEKDLIIYVFLGTHDGEWFSNINLSSTKNNDSLYADTFYEAGLSAYNDTKEYIEGFNKPIILVTGHSRGGATANVLGHILNEKYDSTLTYTYSYATPNTYKGEKDETKDRNIFNLLNRADLVTKVPFDYMGFKRFGIDKYIGGSQMTSLELNSTINKLSKLIKDVDEYYNKKFSLTSSGLDSKGMSVYEYVYYVMNNIFKYGLSFDSGATNKEKINSILPQVSEESDLYATNQYFTKKVCDELTSTVSVLLQHGLSVYESYIISSYDLYY